MNIRCRPEAAYRALFRTEIDADPITNIRLALNQNHVLGDSKFHRKIEKAMSERRQARPRGRPRTVTEPAGAAGVQRELGV